MSSVNSIPSMTNYLKCLCKIVLEWIKAVVVVLCLREQGLNYDPGVAYTVFTFIYYICSEQIFLDILPTLLECLSIEQLDKLEYLYVPIVMKTVSIVLGCIITFCNLLFDFSKLTIYSFYFIIHLRVKDVYLNEWQDLVTENEIYKSFRIATEEDIEEWADICAVCLSNLNRAVITPCRHLFHPHCLKRCLKVSLYCPLCKHCFT